MRLIDADALRSALREKAGKCFTLELWYKYWLDGLIASDDAVEAAPTVDAVTVVRCKECKYGYELCDSVICIYHNADGNYCEDDGFCAWGERSEDAD